MRVSKPHRKVNKAVKAHKAGRRVQPHGPKPIIGADLKIYKRLCEVTDEAGSIRQEWRSCKATDTGSIPESFMDRYERYELRCRFEIY